MKSARLALNRWTMGQVLMPAHFYSLQDTILEYDGIRARLHGLPGYGIARMTWDQEGIAKGAISISELTVVFPSGHLIDVPGNATISNLNLGDESGDRATVFLHLLKQTEELTVADDPQDPPQVPRQLYRIELSTRTWQDNANHSLKLVELERELGSDWRIGAYVPPLVQVGTSSFLADLLQELDGLAAQLERDVATQLSDIFLGQEHVIRLQRGLAATYSVRALVADLQEQVHLHPYHLFASMRGFYVEVCLLYGDQPESPPFGYDHDDLGKSFADVLGKLRAKLGQEPVTSVRLPFANEDYYFIAQPFPEELERAQKVYLVVQNPSGEPVSLDEVKFASPSRLEPVHSLSLPGVEIEPVTSPGFHHTFGGRAQLFLLEHRSDEWAQALREGALCFYARDDLLKISAALSWQL